MCNSDHSELVGADLVDDAVGEPAQQIAPAGTSEYGTNLWVGQYHVYPVLELREERKAQLKVGARPVEGSCIMQIGERSRDDGPFHFSAARTRASASSIGIS